MDASPISLEYQGKSYKLGDVDPLNDFPVIEKHFQSLKPNPIDAILPELEKLKNFPAAQERLLDRAYEQLTSIRNSRPAADEVKKWLESCDGVKYVMWFMIHKNHPEVTPEFVIEMLQAVGEEAARQKQDAVMRARKAPAPIDASAISVEEVAVSMAESKA